MIFVPFVLIAYTRKIRVEALVTGHCKQHAMLGNGIIN